MFRNIKVYLFWITTQASFKQSTPGQNTVDSPEKWSYIGEAQCHTDSYLNAGAQAVFSASRENC